MLPYDLEAQVGDESEWSEHDIFASMRTSRKILTVQGVMGVLAGLLVAVSKPGTHDHVIATLFFGFGVLLIWPTFSSKSTEAVTSKLAVFFAVACFVGTLFMFFPAAVGLVNADDITNANDAATSWFSRMQPRFIARLVLAIVNTHDDRAAAAAALYFFSVAVCAYVDSQFARRHFEPVLGGFLVGGSVLSCTLVLPTNWSLGPVIFSTSLVTTIAMAAAGAYDLCEGVYGGLFGPVRISRYSGVCLKSASLPISFVGGWLMVVLSTSRDIGQVAQGDVAMFGWLFITVSAVQILDLVFTYLSCRTNIGSEDTRPDQKALAKSLSSFFRKDLGCHADACVCARVFDAVRERDRRSRSKFLTRMLSWHGYSMPWATFRLARVADTTECEDLVDWDLARVADEAACNALEDSEADEHDIETVYKMSTQQLRNGARKNRSVLLVAKSWQEYRRVDSVAFRTDDFGDVYTKIQCKTSTSTPRDRPGPPPEARLVTVHVSFTNGDASNAWPCAETIALAASSGDLLFASIMGMYRICTPALQTLFKYSWAQQYGMSWLDGETCGEQVVYGCGGFSERLGGEDAVGRLTTDGKNMYVPGICSFEDASQNVSNSRPMNKKIGTDAPEQQEVAVYVQPRAFYDRNKCRIARDEKLLAGQSDTWDMSVFSWLLLWSAHDGGTGKGRGLLRDSRAREAVNTLRKCRNALAHNKDAIMTVEEFNQHTDAVMGARVELDDFATRVMIPDWPTSVYERYVNCVGGRLSTSMGPWQQVTKLLRTMAATIRVKNTIILGLGATIRARDATIRRLRHGPPHAPQLYGPEAC